MMSAVFRFHLHVGIRLALRIFVPVVSIFFALYYLLRPELFNSLMAQILDGGFLLSGITATFFCVNIAGFASRRICLGLSGWIRHLPIGGKVHRRMAGLAIFIAQIPALMILAGLTVVAQKLYQVSIAPFMVGLPLVGLSCGLCVLPVERKLYARPLAILASLGFSSNDWALLAGGILLLIAADGISGPIVQKKKHTPFHKPLRGMLLMATVNWRALRLRPLVLYILTLPFLGAAQLFIANNEPAPLLAEKMIRFGGALGLILFCSLSANILASRRPPWPWIRSLPWLAKSRIVWDSLFIGLHALPIIVLVGVMNLKSMFPIALSLPLLSVHSAYSIRQASESVMGPSGKVLLLGTLGSILLCLLPWSSVCFLVLTPVILSLATKAEKHQKVSRWLEIHHLAAGDSLSWSE
ncbi:MAG: hypothetical protein JSV17_12935 [Candidatus Aminicenantes bacterium]|nr:MAG: hypothetical protein JSV17_12935 [Candidatus Aminicenantes bacterium]